MWKPWKRTLSLMAAALALGLILAGATLCAPPEGKGKPPKDEDPVAGTIYFEADDGSVVTLWSMSAGGSNKTLLPIGVSQPSKNLHGPEQNSHRWFLEIHDDPQVSLPPVADPPVFGGDDPVSDDLATVSYWGDHDPGSPWEVFYMIQIDGEGDPDTFSWWASGINNPEDPMRAQIPITPEAQALTVLAEDGTPLSTLTIQFGSTTGHTLGDGWWIRVTKGPYQAVVAVNEQGDVVPLTHASVDPDLIPEGGRKLRWFADDQGVSFLGSRWDIQTQTKMEPGIYTLPVDFDASGFPGPAGTTQLTFAGVNGNYDWNPEGTQIVVGEGEDGLSLIDVAEPALRIPLTDTSGYPQWSPDGSRIAFSHVHTVYGDGTYYSIRTITPQGTEETTLVSTKINWTTRTGKVVWDPCWSPTGSHLAYRQTTMTFKGTGMRIITDVHRMSADGQGEANLTKDFGPEARPVAWR